MDGWKKKDWTDEERREEEKKRSRRGSKNGRGQRVPRGLIMKTRIFVSGLSGRPLCPLRLVATRAAQSRVRPPLRSSRRELTSILLNLEHYSITGSSCQSVVLCSVHAVPICFSIASFSPFASFFYCHINPLVPIQSRRLTIITKGVKYRFYYPYLLPSLISSSSFLLSIYQQCFPWQLKEP